MAGRRARRRRVVRRQHPGDPRVRGQGPGAAVEGHRPGHRGIAPPLHVHEFGDPDGAPVVCVHGVTGHGERFRTLGEGSLAGRRLVAPDLRGHGRSSWEPPWDTATLAADLLAVAGEEPVDWLGFSFGGRVLARLAAAAPERVRRLCLLDPAIRLPAAACLELAEVERAGATFASPEEAIEARLATGTLLHTPRELLEAEMGQHLVEREDGRFAYRYCVSAAVTAWSEMAAPEPPVADAPTLFVRGESSWIDLDAQEARYRERLGSRLEVVRVPGGHSVLWDAFEPTARALADFLDA